MYMIYMSSFYYITITISTVGYGDITPISNKEKLFVIFLTLFSCINYAYTLSKIGEILSELNQDQ